MQYAEKDTISRAVRNLPGVETASVDALNLLQLAPGGHVGRFIVWTKAAFERLEAIYDFHVTCSLSTSGRTATNSPIG